MKRTKLGSVDKRITADAGLVTLYNKYKYRAFRKNLSFDIGIIEFSLLTSSPCFYCGENPKQTIKPSARTIKRGEEIQYVYNGLDRVDNVRGYISGNILPCCKFCNYAKRDMNVHTFLDHINKIHINCKV